MTPVEDLGAYLVAGRVAPHLPDDIADETAVRTIAQGIQDGVDDGPAGTYNAIKLGDTYEGPMPRVFYGTFGLPKAAAAVARSFDGVILPGMMTPEYGNSLVRVNDWDPAPVLRLRDGLRELQQSAREELADTAFHRRDLLQAADLVPPTRVASVPSNRRQIRFRTAPLER